MQSVCCIWGNNELLTIYMVKRSFPGKLSGTQYVVFAENDEFLLFSPTLEFRYQKNLMRHRPLRVSYNKFIQKCSKDATSACQSFDDFTENAIEDCICGNIRIQTNTPNTQFTSCFYNLSNVLLRIITAHTLLFLVKIIWICQYPFCD